MRSDEARRVEAGPDRGRHIQTYVHADDTIPGPREETLGHKVQKKKDIFESGVAQDSA